MVIQCKVCTREPIMYWSNKEKTTGHSEMFYTNKEGKTVCHNCLTKDEVNNYKGLQELNKQRKK